MLTGEMFIALMPWLTLAGLYLLWFWLCLLLFNLGTKDSVRAYRLNRRHYARHYSGAGLLKPESWRDWLETAGETIGVFFILWLFAPVVVILAVDIFTCPEACSLFGQAVLGTIP